MPQSGTNEPIQSVGNVINAVNKMLNDRFLPLWVTGEVSNLHTGLHWYFDLIDPEASLSCAAFARVNQRFPRGVANGTLVNVHGRLGIYKDRGQFQLIVDRLELAGEGALRAEFERLKRALEKEGLFSDEHKKPLPEFPKRVALLTGERGAALTDVEKNFARRYPLAQLTHIPTLVQGRKAPAAIVRALQIARDKSINADIVLLTRGGGSYEDLNAFNDESVARAIFACPLPVVSAIGHERDYTIADFVADKRAPTPSTAVELMSPDRGEWWRRIDGIKRQLVGQFGNDLRERMQRLAMLRTRLGQPTQLIDAKRETLVRLLERLDSASQSARAQRSSEVAALDARLRRATPMQQIEFLHQQLNALNHRLNLVNPRIRLKEFARREREAKRRLQAFGASMLQNNDRNVADIQARLQRANPLTAISDFMARVAIQKANLTRSIQSAVESRQTQLDNQSATLRAVSPLATLERGYAVVTKPDGSKWGEIVSSIQSVKPGEAIQAHLHAGTIAATVQSTEPRNESETDHATSN